MKRVSSGAHSQYCYTLLHLRYLLISLIRIKGIRMGDYNIKIANFTDNTIILLRVIMSRNPNQPWFSYHYITPGWWAKGLPITNPESVNP